MYTVEIVHSRLLLFVCLLVAFTRVKIVEGVTLRPPIPPTKVVALAGLSAGDGGADKMRYYSFQNDKDYPQVRPVSDWEPSYSSGDPFEVPSLSVIAEMMRRRDAEREQNRGGSEGSSSGGGDGWGWPKPEPPTTPRPPPPTTEGWGWKPETTTWVPPPPPPTTRGWGWKPETTQPPTTKGWGWPANGVGSYAPVDKKDSVDRFYQYGKGEESPGTGWGTTSTTPKYNPIYLSSDEAKYKPIKYPTRWDDKPSSWAVGSGKGKLPVSSDPNQPSSWPVSSGSQVPYPPSEGGGGKPAHYPFWPDRPAEPETQGPGWYPKTTTPPPKEEGWGWPKPEPPTRPPPTRPPPTKGWGWSSAEAPPESPPPTPSPFEYKPGTDDLTKNIFPPDTYIRPDYPPGINPTRDSFEDDDFPSEPNHYRLVPYTPSPEEQYKLARNPPAASPGVGVPDRPPSPFYGGGGNRGHYQAPFSPREREGNKGPPSDTGDSREKWFSNNFQRFTTTSTTPPPTSRDPPPPTRPTRPTTKLPPSGGKDANSGGKPTGPAGSNAVTDKTTEKSKRPARFDEHGFKYIPYNHPIARKISSNQRDIYDNLDYTNDGDSLRRDNEPQGSETRESHIRLWTAEDPSGRVRPGPGNDGDLEPPPFFTREALLARSKEDLSVSPTTPTKSSCPSGEVYSKRAKKCERPKRSSSPSSSPSSTSSTRRPKTRVPKSPTPTTAQTEKP